MAGSIGALLAALAKYPQLDRRAVLAVARQEGLGGGIGDGGHAYGPFQLNNAGGVITNIHRGVNDPSIQSWAWSPQGLDFALSRIAKVAAGKRGADAVRAIVSQFERPADPAGEISRAIAGLGTGAPVPPSVPSAPAVPPAPASAPQGAESLSPLLQIFANNQATVGAPTSLAPLLALALSPKTTAPGDPVAPATKTAPTPPIAGAPVGGIAELLHEQVGGPTHSTGEHIHVAFANPQTGLYAIKLAQRLGLVVRENPYVGDTVDPVHASNSYHTRTFPGLYHGRKLGQAIDVHGTEAAMTHYYNELAKLRR
jgi:hypothetical protein